MSKPTETRISNGKQNSVLFDLANPNWDHININVLANSLSRQARFNGHLHDRYEPNTYSVAQHAVLCAGIQYRSGHDTELVLSALHHDDVEAVTGDNVSPLKNTIPELKQFCDRLQEGYAKHVDLDLDHATVKWADKLMYYYEVYKLFSAECLSDGEYQVLCNNNKVLEPIIVWSKRIAEQTYIDVHENPREVISAIAAANTATAMDRRENDQL